MRSIAPTVRSLALLTLLTGHMTSGCGRDPAGGDEPPGDEDAGGATGATDEAQENGGTPGETADDPSSGDDGLAAEDPTEAGAGGAEADGAGGAEAAGAERGEPEPFAVLFREVFQPANCANAYCHHIHAPHGDADAAAFRAWLVDGKASTYPCGAEAMPLEVPLVVPGEPDASLLYLKVAPGVQVCGSKMPSGTENEGLAAADAERVRAWIAAGAGP